MPRLLSVGTAVPARRLAQEEIAAACAPAFAEAFARGKSAVFENSGVAGRHLAEDSAWYFTGVPFAARNDAYLKHALELSERSLRSAVRKAGLELADLSHLFGVTTTGLLTPSLEARLAQALPLRRTIKRTPIFGAGCAGGAVGLARAQEYLRGHKSEAAALLSTEVCSMTFLPGDGSMTQLVAAALFGDGSASAVLVGDDHPAAGGGGLEVVASESVLLPDSLDIMGWEFGAHGMRLVLSPRAPQVVEDQARGAFDAFLRGQGLKLRDIGRFALHPGSSRILDALERALDLTPRDTEPSRVFLSRYGNLSSASLLFILGDILEGAPAEKPFVLAAALGPGFACELTLLRRP